MTLARSPAAAVALDYDLRHLSVFVDVCVTKSMTETAHRAGLTQPAVSQTISILEKAMGAPILDRNQRPLQLTPAGRVLFSHAKELVNAAHRLSQEVRRTANNRYPALRIGVVDSMVGLVAVDLMKFLEPVSHALSVWGGLAPAHRTSLVNRRADLVISSDPFEDMEDIERYELVVEPFVVVLPRSHEHLRAAPLQELARHLPLARYSGHSHIGMQVDQHLRRLRLEVPRVFDMDASEAVFAAVRSGMCWALSTPLCVVSAGGETDAMVMSELKPGCARGIYLVARRSELGDLPAKIAELVAESIWTRGLEQLFPRQPWLRDRIKLPFSRHPDMCGASAS